MNHLEHKDRLKDFQVRAVLRPSLMAKWLRSACARQAVIMTPRQHEANAIKTFAEMIGRT